MNLDLMVGRAVTSCTALSGNLPKVHQRSQAARAREERILSLHHAMKDVSAVLKSIVACQ